MLTSGGDGKQVLIPKPHIMIPFPFVVRLKPGDHLRILHNGYELLDLRPTKELLLGALIGPLPDTEYAIDIPQLNNLKDLYGKEANYGISGV